MAKDGVSVSSMTRYYYLSNSRTNLNGGSWSSIRPTTIPSGYFLWARELYVYSDGHSVYTDAACISGADGHAYNTAPVYIYKRSTSQPTDLPSVALVYTFSQHTKYWYESVSEKESNGWYLTTDDIPTSSTGDIWIRMATITSLDDVYCIQSGEWSTAVKWTGSDGDNITIKEMWTKYAYGTNQTHPDPDPDGTDLNWHTANIVASKGSYVWTWRHTKFSDGTVNNEYTCNYIPLDGTSIPGNPGHNVWFRTSEWQSNTDYYDGNTALYINNQYLYPLDYISVTDNNNQTASYYYCASRHTSGDTFDVGDGWAEMSSMGALYAPLAWFNKALINYIQAQKALFGNMVLDAMGANNPNMIPCTYSGSKSVWHYDYGSHNGAGVFVINYNSNGYGQIYSGYGKDITLVAGHTYTISAKARTLGSSTPHTIRLFVLNYVYRDGQYRENYYVVNDGTSYSGYYAPKFDGNNWYITINGTNHYITNYTPSYGEWHAERMNIYPSDGWITIKKTFIVSQNTAYQWDGMHVKIRLDLNDNSVTTDYAEIKDLKLEEGESVTADDHIAEMLGYVSQQDMQSRLDNQATLIEGGYIRTTLIKAINVVANKIYAEFGEGIPAVTINSDNDGAIKQYWTGTNQPRLIIKDGKISWYKSDGSISKEITEDTANAVVIYNSTKPGTWTYIRLKDVTSVVMKTTKYGNVTDGILYAQWVSNNDYTGENASQYKSADGYIVRITWADNNLNPPITSTDAENLINGNFIRNGSALWIDGAYRRLVYDITRSGTSQTITTRYELVGDTTGDVPSIGA